MNNNYNKAEKALQSLNLKNVKIVLNRGKNEKQCINITVYDKDGNLVTFKKGNKDVDAVSTSTLIKQEAFEDLYKLIDSGKNPYINACRSTCSKNDAFIKLSENIHDDKLIALVNAGDFDKAKTYIYEKMDILDEREKNILKLRYGLDNNVEKIQSLEAISKIYNITREAVRQLEAKALRKLRES